MSLNSTSTTSPINDLTSTSPTSDGELVISTSTPSSPSTTTSTTIHNNKSTTKKQHKDSLSAQILLGLKQLASPQSLSAPSSPLPVQAPSSPSTMYPSIGGDDILTSKPSPTSPRGANNNNAATTPTATTPSMLGMPGLTPDQSNAQVCTFKECLLCRRDTPFVNNQSPTWACIMRIVFYCLQLEMPQKPFLNLKTDVYGFMTAHWHLLCLDKKRSDNWHKQIQDMLSHSKNLFESGMDTYKQNGYWRMKQISDPWDEIKSKKILTKRKRSYSEADKDHSMKQMTSPLLNSPNSNQAIPNIIVNNKNNSNNNNNVVSPIQSYSQIGDGFQASIERKFQENLNQLSSHMKSVSSQSLTPRGTQNSPRIKKKVKGDHLHTPTHNNNNSNNNNNIVSSSLSAPTSTNTSPNNGTNQGSGNIPPIPTIPLITSMLDDSTTSSSSTSPYHHKITFHDNSDDGGDEHIEEIKYEDESPIGLLLLSSTRHISSASAANNHESSGNLLPTLNGVKSPAKVAVSPIQHHTPMVCSSANTTANDMSVSSVEASNVPPAQITILSPRNTNNIALSSSSPNITIIGQHHHHHQDEGIYVEEISRLRNQLKQIHDNLTVINQSGSSDPMSIKPMLEKEINRINNIYNRNSTDLLPISTNSATNIPTSNSDSKQPPLETSGDNLVPTISANQSVSGPHSNLLSLSMAATNI